MASRSHGSSCDAEAMEPVPVNSGSVPGTYSSTRHRTTVKADSKSTGVILTSRESVNSYKSPRQIPNNTYPAAVYGLRQVRANSRELSASAEMMLFCLYVS